MLQANPLSNHNLFESHDLEETRARISDYLWPHQMQILGRSSEVTTRLDGVSFDCIDLFSLEYGTEVQLEPGEIEGYYLVQTTLCGSGHVKNGSRCADTRVGLTTIVSPSEPTSITMDAACRRLILRVEREALERQVSLMLNRELKQPLVFNLELSHSSQEGIAWLQTLEYLCQQYNLCAGTLENQAIRKQFASMAMTLLIGTQPHNYTDQLKTESHVVLPRHVRQARDYIEANLGEPINMSELAAQFGVTPRTLQSGFQRFLDQTPSEYIRELKLKRAHEALQAADPDSAQVTDILLGLGVSNAGRFAQLYKKRFGCLPSHTLKHAHS